VTAELQALQEQVNDLQQKASQAAVTSTGRVLAAP